MEFASGASDSGDALDPRIQIELENLNSATEDINKLESELDEANSIYNKILSELPGHLSEIADKIGSSCIDKARCYYKAAEEVQLAQIQCQHQARLFHRASELHAAAKKNAASAESRCMSNKQDKNLDQAWQDMLNHATTKVMNAANQRAECEKQHLMTALVLQNAERRAQQLESKYHRAIIKARPYFEVRTFWNEKSTMQKQQVDCLQKAVRDAKRNYAKSFRALEDISNQIHEQRRDYVNGPREPGVGAELLSPVPSLDYEAEPTKEFEEISAIEHRGEDIDNRLVDGRETTLSQWEIEFQTNENKLNDSTSGSECSSQSRLDNSNPECSPDPATDSCQQLPKESPTWLSKDNKFDDVWRASIESPSSSISEKSNSAKRTRSLSKSMGDISANIDLSFDMQRIKSNLLTNCR